MRKELLFPACAFLASCTAVPDDDPATATSNVRTARIRTPQGVRTVSYRMVDGRPVSGGDIILPDSVLRSDLYAAPALVDHWDDGVVPFVAGSLPQFYEDELTDARRTFQRETGVRFRAATPNDDDVVWFTYVGNTGICLSDLGQEGGDQTIEVADGCDESKLIHEMMHTLGMYHEQSRPDRDDHVRVFENHIIPEHLDQFTIHEIDERFDFGPYDFDSIMHYPSDALATEEAINAGKHAMTKLDGSLIPLNTVLSEGDLRVVESIYPAPGGPDPSVCRVAPYHGLVSPFSVAEVWEDIDDMVAIERHDTNSSATGFDDPESASQEDGGWELNTRWAVGDFDGDSEQDLVAIWKQDGMNTLTFWDSNQGKFVPDHWLTKVQLWDDEVEWLPGNFNGDAYTDLISVHHGANNTVTFKFWRSTGSSFASPVVWPANVVGDWVPNAKWNVADFDGDERDDLFTAWPEGTGTTFTIRFSRVSQAQTPFLLVDHWKQHYGGWANNMQFLVGNFDGTGGPDVMVAWEDNNLATLTYYQNLGNKFADHVHWSIQDGGWANNVRWSAGDYDGDGLTDVLAAWNEGGRSTLAVRSPTGTSNPYMTVETWNTRVAGWKDSTSWCSGQFSPTSLFP